MLSLRSVVANYSPHHPLQFSNDKGELKPVSEIIKKAAPEFYDGYRFWVNPLLSTGHAQTAYTALNKFETCDQIHYKREVITVEDVTYPVNGRNAKYDQWKGHSTFTVDYVVEELSNDYNSEAHLQYKPSHQVYELPPRTQYLNPEHNQDILNDDRPLLIALHGLSGGSFESYVRSLLHQVSGVGFDSLVINSRGCANHTITSPQLFCGLWTNDLRYFINEHVKKRWPQKPIYLVGFSLGGSIVANFLGQEKDDVYHNIKGAFVLGAPWDFSDSSHALLESLLGDKIYSPVMSKNLLKLLDKHYEGQLKNEKVVQAYRDDPSGFTLNRLRDFDDNFTSKLFGFNNCFEYYRHASPLQRLFKIRVPTFIISSFDDPVCGMRSLPIEEARINPYTYVITTSIGGHLGWFDYKHDRWYSGPLASLLKELKNWNYSKNDIKLPMDIDKVWQADRLYYE